MMNNSQFFKSYVLQTVCCKRVANVLQTRYKRPHFNHFSLLCLDTINAYFKPFIRIYQL